MLGGQEADLVLEFREHAKPERCGRAPRSGRERPGHQHLCGQVVVLEQEAARHDRGRPAEDLGARPGQWPRRVPEIREVHKRVGVGIGIVARAPEQVERMVERRARSRVVEFLSWRRSRPEGPDPQPLERSVRHNLPAAVSRGLGAEGEEAVEASIAQPQPAQEDVRHRQLQADGRMESDGARRAVRPCQRRQERRELLERLLDLRIVRDRRSGMEKHRGLGERLVGAEALVRLLLVAVPVSPENCERALGDPQGQAQPAHQVVPGPHRVRCSHAPRTASRPGEVQCLLGSLSLSRRHWTRGPESCPRPRRTRSACGHARRLSASHSG